MYGNEKIPSQIHAIKHVSVTPSVHHSYDYLFRSDYPEWCLRIDREGFTKKKHQEFNLKQAIKKSDENRRKI